MMKSSRCSQCWTAIFVFIGLGQSYEILLKTRETFKLADVQLLTAQQHANEDSSCERLVLDARTGASLLRFQCDVSSLCNSNFATEIDWKGHILARGSSAEALVGSVGTASATWDLDKPWTLRYLVMAGEQTPPNYGITGQSLLCAVSQSIRRPHASLIQEGDDIDRLLVLRIAPSNETGSETFYLVQTQSIAVSDIQIDTRLRWSKRPFPYSSAINYEIAEMAVGLVLGRLQNRSVIPRLLDPTCGSGSFLAVAMSLGITDLQGRDSNPICIEGTKNNLEMMFGSSKVTKNCQLVVHDSAKPFPRSGLKTKSNCMCCNLPWGENTKSFSGENVRILSAVRQDLEVKAPCVVVWRISAGQDIDDLDEVLQGIGYRALGHAFVPPKGFQLPKIGKIKNASTQTGRSICLVSVLETSETERPK